MIEKKHPKEIEKIQGMHIITTFFQPWSWVKTQGKIVKKQK